MRCIFRYPSGDQCVYNGCKTDIEMCPAHTLIERGAQKKAMKHAQAKREVAERGVPKAIQRPRVKSKVTQPSRVQAARAVIDRLPEVVGPPTDPIAPWCTCTGRPARPCEECGKPDWLTWREMKAKVSDE